MEGDKSRAELARAREAEGAYDHTVSVVTATTDADVGWREVEEVKVRESEEEGVSVIELVKHAGRLDVTIREQGSMTRGTEECSGWKTSEQARSLERTLEQEMTSEEMKESDVWSSDLRTTSWSGDRV